MTVPIKAFKCPRCEKSNYKTTYEKEKETIGGKEIEYKHYFYKCKECGKEFVDRQLIRKTDHSYKLATGRSRM